MQNAAYRPTDTEIQQLLQILSLPGGIMCVLDEDKAGIRVEIIFGDSPEQEADYGS